MLGSLLAVGVVFNNNNPKKNHESNTTGAVACLRTM